MILFVHMLFGAVIASRLQDPFLAVGLAFLSHYFLDAFPHIEYNIDNIDNKKWKKALPEFIKVFFDFLAGIILSFGIYIFSGFNFVVLIAGFFAALPDALTFLNYLFPNKILDTHDFLHKKLIHYFKEKAPLFWRILTQVLAITLALLILKI